MKKTLTLSLLMATSLLAEVIEPIPVGVRGSLNNYLSISPTLTATTDGKINYNLIKNCFLRNGNLATTTKDALGERKINVFGANGKLEKEYATLSNSYFLSSNYVCSNKNNSGDIIFKAFVMTGGTFGMANGASTDYHWIVEHSAEQMMDKGQFDRTSDHGWVLPTRSESDSERNRQKLSAEYATYEAFFNDWLKHPRPDSQEKIARDGNYAFHGAEAFRLDLAYPGMFDISPSMTPALSEMRYFCEGHKGDFMKDGKPFLKTVEAFIRDGAVYSTREKYFNGRYACTSGEAPFNVELSGDKMIVKKGFSPAFFVGSNNQSYLPQSTSQESASIINDDTMIVKNVAMTKGPFSKKQGALNYFGTYNGVDNEGCGLVSVTKSVDRIKNSQDVFNYKYCNGVVMALGETGLPGIPRKSELEPIINSVKTSCKQYGAFGTQYNENTIVSCRSLDINHCNLEITIMQDNKLLNKQVIDSCK